MNYFHKYSPVIPEICKAIWRLTSVKSEWTWYKSCKELYDKPKALIKKDTCMKFCNNKTVYLKMDTLGVDFMESKSLFRAKTHYSNIEWETLGIQHGLQKFHQYGFTRGTQDHRLQKNGINIQERCSHNILRGCNAFCSEAINTKYT